jgi:hypothetical protein
MQYLHATPRFFIDSAFPEKPASRCRTGMLNRPSKKGVGDK